MSEIWKGKYKDQGVALKVFKGVTHEQKAVSVFRAIQKGRFAFDLKNILATSVQRGGSDEAGRS